MEEFVYFCAACLGSFLFGAPTAYGVAAVAAAFAAVGKAAPVCYMLPQSSVCAACMCNPISLFSSTNILLALLPLLAHTCMHPSPPFLSLPLFSSPLLSPPLSCFDQYLVNHVHFWYYMQTSKQRGAGKSGVVRQGLCLSSCECVASHPIPVFFAHSI